MYASNQNSIQRYLSIKKWTDASKAMMIRYLLLSIEGNFLRLRQQTF